MFNATIYHYFFTVGHITWRAQSSMFRVCRCTLYCHCHHYHCHYKKCQCRIHLLHFMWSNRNPILYHLATCFLQQVLLKIFVGAMLVVVVLLLVVVVVVVVVFLRLHAGFCVISAFCFAGFISSSVAHWTTKAKVHLPYFWSTLSSVVQCKGQFA